LISAIELSERDAEVRGAQRIARYHRSEPRLGCNLSAGGVGSASCFGGSCLGRGFQARSPIDDLHGGDSAQREEHDDRRGDSQLDEGLTATHLVNASF
jgi:hypothetical protein